MMANSESHPDITYAIIASGYPAGPFLGYGCEFLLKSSDKGESWEEINFPQGFASLAWHAFVIEVNPEDPDIIWLGGLDMWRTLDGGETWLHLTNWNEPIGSSTGKYVHADIHVIMHNPNNPRELYAATDGGVFFTGSSLSPDNVVFHEMNDNLNTLQFYSGAIYPETGVEMYVGGLQDNGTLFYQQGMIPDRGTKLGGGDGAFCFIDKDDPDLTLVTHYYTALHLRSINPNGSPTFYGSFLANCGTFINPMDYNWKTNTLYCNVCDFSGVNANILGVIQIEDWQMSGLPVELATNSSVPFSCVKWDENTEEDMNTVYLGTGSGRLFRLLDDQDPQSLTEITGEDFPTGFISSIDIGQSPDTLMLTFTNYGVNSVWMSTDAGVTWNNIESNLPDMPVRWGIFHPQSSTHIMLATETGIWTTNNSLNPVVTWSPDIDGMANVRVDMLQFRDADNTVLAATHGRGMFTTQWNMGGTSSIENIITSDAIRVFPNPCDGEFRIKTELSRDANLTIMDTQGKIVHSEYIQAGTIKKDIDLGREPEGLYIIKLDDGTSVKSSRILVK